jgi:hypothetical protein
MRKKKKQRFIYDKLGRITFYNIADLDLTYEYIYCDDLNICSNRKCIIKNENNNSNFKTVITQKFLNKNYIDLKKEEFGDIYEITTEYNEEGKEINIERINKLKNTFYSKLYIRNKNGELMIWIEKYNEQKNIGFRIKKDLIF